MERDISGQQDELDPHDSGAPAFELDQNGIEIIPFDTAFHTRQGEYSGHKVVFIDGESHYVHTLPNFPAMFNRFIDFSQGVEPESLIAQVTYAQYADNDMAAALAVFEQSAPNLYQKLLSYREEVNYVRDLKARGPRTEEEKAFLYEADNQPKVPLRDMAPEEKQAAIARNREDALKRLYYSRAYQLLGGILIERDPAFDLRVLST